jgi:hypothetical protein
MGGTGGSGPVEEPLPQPAMVPEPAVAPEWHSTSVVVTPAAKQEKKNVSKKGAYVLLGGGADFYTGKLAPEINAGLNYGLTVGVKPDKYFGIEANYNGALSNLDQGFANSHGLANANNSGASSGTDIVRNSGQVAATIGLSPTAVQPFILGGVGIDNYTVRRATVATGFNSDTSAYIPTGLGLRANMGKNLTADLRGTYNFLINQNFSGQNTGAGTGRLGGMLQIGGTY